MSDQDAVLITDKLETLERLVRFGVWVAGGIGTCVVVVTIWVTTINLKLVAHEERIRETEKILAERREWMTAREKGETELMTKMQDVKERLVRIENLLEARK